MIAVFSDPALANLSDMMIPSPAMRVSRSCGYGAVKWGRSFR
jgi:hypothetical protein